MIFDTISIKARWEQWCRRNCDLRVINAHKKGIFCCTESVAVTPKSRDHMPTTSLWGVAAKWPTRALKTKLILCPRDTVWACQSKPHAVFHGVCKIAFTEVLATQMGVMWCSKKVSSFELYQLNPLSPHCGSIARELVHCYAWGCLRIVIVRSNTVGQHS